MFVALFLAVLVSATLWLTLKWLKVRRFWADRGVSHNPPHPVLGSLTFLQKQNTAHWMLDMYKQFKVPYVGIWLFWRPALIINSPEIARRVLVKDADNFRNRFLSSGKSDPIGNLNLFTTNEPLWSTVRRRLTTVFTAAKLRSLEGLITSKAGNLVQRLDVEAKRDPDAINIRVINSDYSTDVIGEAAFGIQSQAALTGDSVIRKVTREFMEFSAYRGLCWSSIFFFPELVDIFRFSFFPKESTRFLEQVFRSVVARRGGFDAPVAEPRDLLDALLKLKQDAAKNNENISEDVLLAQATVFVQGGFDTTGSSLTWILLELAHAPDIQEHLYRELVEARQNYGKELDSSALAEVTYLNAVIKESLRKFSPMGWLDRIADKDYQIDEHLKIPAGTPVYVNAFGMMWDPQYFPEPEVYDPSRFLPENEKNIVPYTYMPFGEGPRNCIGMRFAWISIRYALAAVVMQFRVQPARDTPAPNDCPVETKGMFLMPDAKVTLAFTPRKEEVNTKFPLRP